MQRAVCLNGLTYPSKKIIKNPNSENLFGQFYVWQIFISELLEKMLENKSND